MTEMVERVARAIASRKGTPWDSRHSVEKEEYLKDARAAIEAMREPLEAAKTAFKQINDFTDSEMKDGDAARDAAETWLERWQAQIDEALK